MNLPDNLPPLPPNTRYAGRLRDHSGRVAAFIYCTSDPDGWEYSGDWVGMDYAPEDDTADWHVALPIEAVRDPAKPSEQLFATLDPENGEDTPSRVEHHLQWLESVRPGWAQEIRECMATGVESRVCEDSPTPSRYRWTYQGITFDFYRLCNILGITSHAQAHALKKVIRAGRGGKTLLQDIDEAIDAMRRFREMATEERSDDD